MLPSQLARLKIRHGEVSFRWLAEHKSNDLERSARLVEIVQGHIGATRRDLEEALRAETDAGRDYRVRRGLGHLLMERTTFESSTELSPMDVRRFVFTEAAREHPVGPQERNRVIEKACTHFRVEKQALEKAMYADLAQNQEITAVPTMTPIQLIHRYNIALVQSALLRCRQLKICLVKPTSKRLRQFYRYLKFYRLLYQSEHGKEDPTIIVDGPSSVVYQSTRYGVSLAQFFPALVLCEQWTVDALVQAKKRSPKGRLRLSSEMGLQSHYPDTGTWVAEEEQALIQRLKELASPLIVSQDTSALSLPGQEILVPDFVIQDPRTKREVAVEIVWRWRRGSLDSRMKLLVESGRSDIILAVCRAGKSEDDIPMSVRDKVISFVQMPNGRSILKRARAMLGVL